MAIQTKKTTTEAVWEWEGRDRSGKKLKGELRADSESMAKTQLLRQGIVEAKLKKRRMPRGKRITERDVVLFTRQMATMMKAGVPLLQSFDIAAKGHNNPSMSNMLMDVRADVESGLSLGQAFANKPKYFDKLFCNLIAAGETGGVLEGILEKLATYKEKVMKIKAQIKSALIYPCAIIAVAIVITMVIMIYVIPVFKKLFADFHTELPAPTRVVIWLSDFLSHWYLLIIPTILLAIAGLVYLLKTSEKTQEQFDALLLKLPVFGGMLRKASISRWARTLATLFAAGVPMVEALESVSGATGNHVYFLATKRIQTDVSMGSTLTYSMQNTGLFPNMVVQMTSIGEESGSLDDMLNKVADFYDEEVDVGVTNLKSLMEPVIMVILGVLIGGLVIAMYMPIFKMGSAVG